MKVIIRTDYNSNFYPFNKPISLARFLQLVFETFCDEQTRVHFELKEELTYEKAKAIIEHPKYAWRYRVETLQNEESNH